MPTIPVLDSQISLRPAPNVQRQPLRSTVGQDIGSGLQAVGQVAQNIQREERLKADRAAFMDADRQTDEFSNGLYAQAQSAQLKDAIGITPKLLEDFDKRTAEVSNGLKSDRQKIAYRESVNSRRAQLQRQLDSHERGQTEAYYERSREDYKAQAHKNAVTVYTDPKAIEGEIAKIASTLDQTPGLDGDQRATELGVRRSGVYAGVIERYLANDDIAGADAYYKSIKDKVNGDRATHIENAINDAKRQAEARAKANQAEARDLLRDQVQDAYTRRSYGLTAQLPSQAAFVAAFGKDGPAQYNAASQMMKAYDVAAEVAMLPPAEARARLEAIRPKESDGPGVTEKARAYEMGVRIASQQRDALEADPAAVILGNDRKLQDAARAHSENPGNAQAADTYFRAMAAKQQTLGIPKPKLLPDAQAAAIGAALNFDPEKPQARAATLAQLSETYGRWLPTVLQQIAPSLDGHSRVVVNMAPESAVRLDAALANKKDIEATTQAATTDIRTTLDAGLAEFANSLSDQPDAGARVAEHREAAELLARSLALRGADGETAARQALQEVLGRYQYISQGDAPVLRAPTFAGRTPLDEDELQAATYYRKQQVANEDLLIVPNRFSTPEQAKRDLASTIRRKGYWVPNEDESGVVLKIPHANGSGEVYRKDGSRVELTWAQLLASPETNDDTYDWLTREAPY